MNINIELAPIKKEFLELVKNDQNCKYTDLDFAEYVGDKKPQLLSQDDQGFYFIEGGLIHYFDKNKNYQQTKFLI